jgi:phospholipid/cholesterol/gamma-HCH transport system ATP-binding protein
MPTAALTAETLDPPSDPSTPVVAFDNVSIAFDTKAVLKDISFSVDHGQTLIILGPAGTGKSVLLKLANGLLAPDSGSIRIFGEEITTMPERDLYKLRSRIGMVFQESALFDSLSVEENVAYRLNEERVPAEESHRRVVEALKFVELADAIAKYPSELSGGMRRRVSIARAIITGPDLILYDSPTGGLDPITSTTIIELVMKQRDVSHTTSLLVTHRLQDAFTLATHRFDTAAGGMKPIPPDPHSGSPTQGIDPGTIFLILNECHIVFHGTTEELVHSTDPWIKRYLE